MEILVGNSDGSLSFGDYSLDSKTKATLEINGDVYKVKTFKEITKLEKNEMFAYESVPGSVVTNFKQSEKEVSFDVESPADVQITLEMEEGKEYSVFAGGTDLGKMTTATGGKLTLSLEGGKTKVEIKEN
ncbi:MAG: endosialidase [Lachnospiraceae bacterium]|nr:endosialidase [Lachnospiraceae bacterium]